MEPLLTSEGGVLAGIFVVVAVSFLLQRIKFFKNFGPALPCIIIGIILGNLKIVPHWHNAYGPFFTYGVPIALTMFLLNINLKEWKKLSKEPLITMGLAVASVAVVTIVAGFIFVPMIQDGWKIAGMFVGTYTGGSSNLTAIGVGLEASSELITAANAADYVVGVPALILLFALPGILGKSKLFHRVWPHSMTEDELIGEDHEELFQSKQWSVTDITVLFGIAFFVAELGTALSQFVPDTISGAIRIILITTFGIILGQIGPVRKLRGNMDLGFFVSMSFLTVLGITVDIKQLIISAPLVTLYCFVVVLGSLIIHLIVCRLLRIRYQVVLVAIMASIGGADVAAAMAGGAKWKPLISIGVVLGAIGMALGNYIGIASAYILKAVAGG